MCELLRLHHTSFKAILKRMHYEFDCKVGMICHCCHPEKMLSAQYPFNIFNLKLGVSVIAVDKSRDILTELGTYHAEEGGGQQHEVEKTRKATKIIQTWSFYFHV